jgi:hypothetical protein
MDHTMNITRQRFALSRLAGATAPGALAGASTSAKR